MEERIVTEKNAITPGMVLGRQVWPVTNARCSHARCADKDGYIAQMVCTNCRDEVPFLITKGHYKPSHLGPECPNCGCREWASA